MVEGLARRQKVLKELVARLPRRSQQALRRWRCARQLRTGTFGPDEPEFALLSDWVALGDWVVDVGANVGQYTCELSRLVGMTGRVFSIEPIIDTFELLTSNVSLLKESNVTLLNVAASDRMGVLGMHVPLSKSGMRNFYQASITEPGAAEDYCVFSLPIDSLNLSHPVSLVKVDAEGHELAVLEGMRVLLREHKPRLIVEGSDPGVERYLTAFGYRFTQLPASPNRVFTATDCSFAKRRLGDASKVVAGQ